MEARCLTPMTPLAGASQQAFGGEDAAVACAACHAREDFQTIYNEQGAVILDKNASDYEMEWSNCTNCHVGDPGEGNVEGGNAYGDATSTSAKALFPAEDYVCGQCHAMFPGAAYLEDANKGIDQYKYGFEPEEMLRAMKEYYEANPATETTICAGMVGVPMLDPEIDTVLYLTDACTEVELFQDSNHQKMGLTCTDCHMPQIEASGGTTYTYHNMTQSPLENPAALEKCLTCTRARVLKMLTPWLRSSRERWTSSRRSSRLLRPSWMSSMPSWPTLWPLAMPMRRSCRLPRMPTTFANAVFPVSGYCDASH